MRVLNIIIFVFFILQISRAQIVLQDPVTARIFNPQKYSNINGSPFLNENWLKGDVMTSRGIYKNLDLKLDLYSNALIYNKSGESIEIADVKKFVLMPVPSDSSTYQYYSKNISGGLLSADQYARVLVDAKKISLYRSDIVSVTEMSEINVGMVKTFSKNTRYFIKKDGVLELVKNTKKDVLFVLRDKEKEITKFIEANELSLRKEEHLIEVFKFYNSL